MEKFIVVAGSPNSGKTISTNMVIEKLVAKGATVETYIVGSKEEFWKKNNRKKAEQLYLTITVNVSQ